MSATGSAVALVTGASSGIGMATAEELAAAGYRVVVSYRTNRLAAVELARRVGGEAYQADAADPAAVAAMVRATEANVGPIAIAVSNAGFYDERPLAEVTDELWDRMIRVHVGGLFHLVRAVVPGMRARGGGSIVAVGSELAFIGGIDIAPYVAAKAAVHGLARSLARELAPVIRVNVVAPGAIDTPLLPDRDRGPGYVSTVPLGRIGRADEIARVIRWVAETSWMTGWITSPNGGAVIQ